jgi:hypothetical protein
MISQGSRRPAGQDQPAAVGGAASPAAATGQRRQRRRAEPALTPQAAYRHWSPMHPPYIAPLVDTARDREISEIVATLAGAGPIERRQLARLVHADLWGPGRFSPALHKAVTQGKYTAPAAAYMRSRPARTLPQTARRPPARPRPATQPGSSPEQHLIPARRPTPGPGTSSRAISGSTDRLSLKLSFAQRGQGTQYAAGGSLAGTAASRFLTPAFCTGPRAAGPSPGCRPGGRLLHLCEHARRQRRAARVASPLRA